MICIICFMNDQSDPIKMKSAFKQQMYSYVINKYIIYKRSAIKITLTRQFVLQNVKIVCSE